MQKVVEILNLALIIILLMMVGVITFGLILLWSPFFLLGMALDYYDENKRKTI